MGKHLYRVGRKARQARPSLFPVCKATGNPEIPLDHSSGASRSLPFGPQRFIGAVVISATSVMRPLAPLDAAPVRFSWRRPLKPLSVATRILQPLASALRQRDTQAVTNYPFGRPSPRFFSVGWRLSATMTTAWVISG